jgi:virginiamycin A acetyltransferase
VKAAVKALARGAAFLAALPALASYGVRSRLLGPDRALEGSSQALGLLPGLLGQYVRRAFYARVLAECHRTAVIEFGVLFSQAGARLEENVYVGPRCHLGLAHIRRNALLAAGVHVPSGAATHGTSDPVVPIRDQAGRREMVTIGESAWIGSGAIVMADVGADSVVGAGAVVTRSIPEGVVAGGVPARIIKTREGRPGATGAPVREANSDTLPPLEGKSGAIPARAESARRLPLL